MKKALSIIIVLIIILASVTAYAANEKDKDFPLSKGSSGPLVIQVQQRLYELGYVSFRATGRYGDMTHEGIRLFQQRNGLSADGMCGKNTYDKLFTEDALRNSGNDNVPRVFGPFKNAVVEPGILADWSITINEIFKVGDTVTVTDYNTGKTFIVRRAGGLNHADVETVSATAFSTYKQIFGGGNTWERRPVIVEIDGTRYAASMIGDPTGSLSGSTMQGTVDMYFLGSTADFAAVKDVEHSAACLKANGQ